MVCAGLQHQHIIPLLEGCNGLYPLQILLKRPLGPCHQHTETCERHLLRHYGGHLLKYLTVCNHQFHRVSLLCSNIPSTSALVLGRPICILAGFVGKKALTLQIPLQLPRLQHCCHTAVVQNVPYGHNLRQDEPPSRGLRINGAHQHYIVTRLHKPLHNCLLTSLQQQAFCNECNQHLHCIPLLLGIHHTARKLHHITTVHICKVTCNPAIQRHNVRLVVHNHYRHIILLEQHQQILLLFTKEIARKYQDCQINLFHQFQSLSYSLSPYLGGIPYPCGINQLHRSYAGNLHPLLHRVGSSTGLLRNYCKILPKKQVYEGTLSHIRPSKNSYMLYIHTLKNKLIPIYSILQLSTSTLRQSVQGRASGPNSLL